MEAMIAGLAGFLAGWVVRSMQRPIGPPRGSYGLRPRHPGSGNGGPTTSKPPTKPQPSGGRMIREDQWNPGWKYLNGPGYQPRPSQRGTPNPPPSNP